MYSVERDAYTETSSNRGQKNVQDLNPDHIIVEIDQLEARVRDSRRMLQQERDSVLQLTKIKTRNEEESKKLADEIIHSELEERQLQERERCLLQACCSAEQSMRLLMQLETQARTKLNEEINVTITKESELKRQFETYTVATIKVQEGFDRQGDSQNIKKLQCEIENKMNLLNVYQKQIDNKEEEKANFENSKIKDIKSWMEFKKLCVSVSEEWLKWKVEKKFVEKLENDKASLERELHSSSANNGNNCNTRKEIPIVRNEPMNDNVQRSKYENKVYDCEEFGGNGNIKETESYGVQDMDIVLPTEQDVLKLPVQPTPKSRNRQVRLGTSLLGSSFSVNTLKKPMSNRKDIKRSEFTLPRLPGLHSVKSKKEQHKLEASKFQELPELHSKVNNQEQNVLEINKMNQSFVQNQADLPVENKQKVHTLETTKLYRENDIENGLSELQYTQRHEKTPKKIDQNPQVLKVSSHKKSLKLGLSLELPKVVEKRSSMQFNKERIINSDNISEIKTIQGDVDIDYETIIKNNDAICDTKSILNEQSDEVLLSSNSLSINKSVTKIVQSGNVETPQKSTKVLGNVSPGTVFCDSKRKERLQELLASPKPTPVTKSKFMLDLGSLNMPTKNDRKKEKNLPINKNEMPNNSRSQMKRDASNKNVLMDNFIADKSRKISESSNSSSKSTSVTNMTSTGNMTPSVIKKIPTEFNISPGTALCDVKRNEKLNKLLASPEPTPAMKSMIMFDPRSMQNHDKPDKIANFVKSKPPVEQRGDKGSTDSLGDHILSPMRSRIQNVNLKNEVLETNTKNSHKSKMSSKQDEQNFSHKQNLFSFEESTSNPSKSDDIFDIGKSNFDFTDKADKNEFSMNFDVSTNSNFQFANFDFGDEEDMENNDNSFSFNFGETSDEPKKKDTNFSLF